MRPEGENRQCGQWLRLGANDLQRDHLLWPCEAGCELRWRGSSGRRSNRNSDRRGSRDQPQSYWSLGHAGDGSGVGLPAEQSERRIGQRRNGRGGMANPQRCVVRGSLGGHLEHGSGLAGVGRPGWRVDGRSSGWRRQRSRDLHPSDHQPGHLRDLSSSRWIMASEGATEFRRAGGGDSSRNICSFGNDGVDASGRNFELDYAHLFRNGNSQRRPRTGDRSSRSAGQRFDSSSPVIDHQVAPPSRRLSGGRPRPSCRGRKALPTASKITALLFCGRLQFHNRPVTPAVLLSGELLYRAVQVCFRLGRHDAGTGSEALSRQTQCHFRSLPQVLQPTRAGVLRHDVEAPLAQGEPDLNLAQATSLPAPRSQVEILFALEAIGL